VDLPEVTLNPGPGCPGPAQPVIVVTAAEISAVNRVPVPADGTDGRVDGPVDGAGDGRTDGAGDGAPALPVPAALPAVVLAGQMAGPAVRAWLTLCHWAAQWRASTAAAIKNPRGPWHAQPESLAAHDAYRRARAWVPPGQPGKVIGPAGNAYHLSGARFGMVTGYAWAWLWARPLRISIAAAVVGAIVLGFWLG
jgi:hypothetical protein